MQMTNSFHNLTDTNVRAYQSYAGDTWGPWQYISTINRSLRYQFFPHFHPYVSGNRANLPNVPATWLSLIQRLQEGGTTELLASDTLYMPQPNPPATGQPFQPLTVTRNSTRIMLSQNASGTRPDGTAVALNAGTPLTLNDGASVVVPKGTTLVRTDGSTYQLAADSPPLALPGVIPVTSSSGIQWNISGTDYILPDNTLVTIKGAAPAVLTDDGTSVTLPDVTPVILRSGIPQPFFYEEFFSRYGPDKSVQQPYPVKNLDFTDTGAYSIYNWEIFFHAPLLIAVHLSQNQQYQDAQRWFHYIFNPMDNSPGPTPERFWKVEPFQYTDVRMIEQILVNLSTKQDGPLHDQTVRSIEDWKSNPFQPFAVARHRPVAYMLKTVMAYLDNLIAWGDSLFQQYTIETINEATQIYVMAANILGPKPQAVPEKGSVKTLTYNNLRGKLDDFGNTLVDLEVDMPFDIAPLPKQGTDPQGTQILGNMGQTLYFCVPRNDVLLGYWDTVADRLFKIHNSLNLQGVYQKLPLYDPPIDPALLVRAAAAGLDVGAIVSGLNQPLPLVRFQLLVGKAAEICQEVKSLGANMLAAIEKQDNESLSLLRAQHENAILALAYSVKYSQWQEAIKARQGLEQSLTNSKERYTYYQKLLGRSDTDIQNALPGDLDAVDQSGLGSLNFTQLDASSEPLADASGQAKMTFAPINPDISKDTTSVSDGQLNSLINHEVEELNKLELARDFRLTASGINTVAAILALIPKFKGHVQPMGCGATIEFGGDHLKFSSESLAAVANAVAEEFTYEAGKAGKLGSYSRREWEWMSQSNNALGEIAQIYKQLRAAQIREAIAEREFNNHKSQMDLAQQVVDFLKGNDIGPGFTVKETTTGFYAYMKRELKALYSKSFQLAFEVAKKAECALQHELGDPTLTYIQYNYLDGIEGLLAGEKLMLDIKTMEMAYHDLNQREYEMTKHASLMQIDPLSLVQLRATGTCTFTLPEEAVDIDFPAYFRRIKSVALTIPCVTGPYVGVNCQLTLQSSSIRTSTDVAQGYARKGSDDPRFSDYYGSVQSIVTSSGQSDAGIFDGSGNDGRLVPFDRAGVAESVWQLTLPPDVRQFDYDTITDVVLHIRYTAREAGDAFKTAAIQNLRTQINKAQTIGSVRLFSVRHEFPSEWARFQSVTIGGATPTAELSLTLLPEHYPFWAQGIVGPGPVKAVELFAEMYDATTTANLYDQSDPTKAGVRTDALSQNPLLGDLLTGSLSNIALPAAVTDAKHPPLTLYCDHNSMNDLWLAITWGKA